MSLTPAQLQAFKTAITGDANLTALLAAGDQGAIAAYYNAASATNVWKPYVAVSDMSSSIVWSAFIALTALQQNAYFAMTQGGYVDATSANVRNGFSSIFGAGATLTSLSAQAQRLATRFEALFTTSNVTAVFGYVVTPTDVAAALGS